MGRMLGAYDEDNQNDRPDLNRCPDCGCYFSQNDCPLCGKPCPEEQRAGNRKVEKKKKKSGYTSDRVIFMEWYHSWWVIILALIFFPIVGVVLLVTSPHKKSMKITVGIIAVLYTVISYFGISGLGSMFSQMWDKPVDTSLSREEYIAACELVTPEEFYRSADAYEDKFVSMTLTVIDQFRDSDGEYYGEEYTTYYMCRDSGGEVVTIMVRDCVTEDGQNYISGDVITVYGEGAGDATVYDMNYEPRTAPCLNAAYIELQK